MYKIIIEKTKHYGWPEDVFWSRVNGVGKETDADEFGSFEEAQPTIKRLRERLPNHFISAIKVG